MLNNPLVSVVVTLYNYEKYIKDCLLSIKKQDYDNIEIIVVDDCSKDESVNVANSVDDVKVIALTENKGYSFCKNVGIKSSKGEVIVLLDADDMLTKKSVSHRLSSLLLNDVEFVYGNAIAVYGDISLKKCYKLKNLPYQNVKLYAKKKPSIEMCNTLYNIHAQTVMVRRHVYQEYGLYDEDLVSRSDREMWWRLFGKSDDDKKLVTHAFVNKSLAYYRYHRKSMRYKRKKNKEKNQVIIAASEKSFEKRKREGITLDNTSFLQY